MSAVQPVSRPKRDEKLRAVCVRSRVSHGELALLDVLTGEVFIGKFFSVDGDTSSAVASSKVTTLGHEAVNDSVESRAFVGITLLIITTAEGTEIFGCFRCVIFI